MSNGSEKKVGLIIGREWSWPSAFISEVNKREAGVVAEFVKLHSNRATWPLGPPRLIRSPLGTRPSLRAGTSFAKHNLI